jgi:hypothetical protein
MKVKDVEHDLSEIISISAQKAKECVTETDSAEQVMEWLSVLDETLDVLSKVGHYVQSLGTYGDLKRKD